MPASDDLTQDRLVATLPVDASGRPSIGGVSLVRKLGVGGMGAVYRGVQESNGREVAVKILPFTIAEEDPQMIARFESEARLAARGLAAACRGRSTKRRPGSGAWQRRTRGGRMWGSGS